MVEVRSKGSSSYVAPAGSENAFSEEWSKNQMHYTPKEPQTVKPCSSRKIHSGFKRIHLAKDLRTQLEKTEARPQRLAILKP